MFNCSEAFIRQKKKKRSPEEHFSTASCIKTGPISTWSQNLSVDRQTRSSSTATSSACVDPQPSCSSAPDTQSDTTAPQHTFLGETTRSQFKIESFEGIVNTTLTVRDDLAEKTTRGVVDFEEVNKLISILQCPQCNHATLSLSTDNKRHKGLAVHATVYCNSCDQSISEGYLAAKRKGTQLYDINRQAVFSSLIAGLGSTTFNNFCESINLTGIHSKTY